MKLPLTLSNMKLVTIPFVLLFLLASSQLVHSQTLERKGTFGARLKGQEDAKGILIEQTIPNTTASAIGVEPKDVLLSVNGKPANDVSELVQDIGKWRVNDPITIQIQRGSKKKTLAGKVVGKPLETSAFGEVIYGQVEYDGGLLRSILELPEGVENPPVLLFLPGVGCGSLDYFYNPDSQVKQFVEGLVKEGIAVYRVEKPGMGDSYGTQDCSEMDYDYEVGAFDAALAKLKTIKSIDPNKVFLFGNSLGVITAPLVASKSKVAGIIAWGGISSTWYEYEMKIQREQRILIGEDYLEVDEHARKMHPFLYDFYIRKQSKDELAKNPDYQEFVEHSFNGDLFHGLHHYTFFQNLNEVDVITAYKNAECPVLTLAGEFDIHTINTRWANEIATAVNHYRPGEGRSVIIPRTTHHFHTVPSLAFYNEIRQNGQLNSAYIAKHFNPDIPMLVQSWIKEIEASMEG